MFICLCQVGFDSGLLVKYDPVTQKEVTRLSAHKDRINRVSFNADKTLFVTASRDCDAKLYDPISFALVREYRTDKPVNGVSNKFSCFFLIILCCAQVL
jgi:translation initiation factor 3 subunit I